jgi:quercetin dioxygenase-like cupin family protein
MRREIHYKPGTAMKKATIYTGMPGSSLGGRSGADRGVRSASFLVLLLSAALAVANPAAEPATVKPLMTRELVGMPGKEVSMITVEYVPGGASRPHRHDAQVFVYVLEGAMTMQVSGARPVTIHPGETFYEAPEDIHLVSANASPTAPAKILVFMVKDKAKPASREVTDKPAP